APSRAKIVASLCPMPLAPPVISATLPASLIRSSWSSPPGGLDASNLLPRGGGAVGATRRGTAEAPPGMGGASTRRSALRCEQADLDAAALGVRFLARLLAAGEAGLAHPDGVDATQVDAVPPPEVARHGPHALPRQLVVVAVR